MAESLGERTFACQLAALRAEPPDLAEQEDEPEEFHATRRALVRLAER